MMTPIFFPFTHISKAVITALGAAFKTILVLQPRSGLLSTWMQKAADGELLTLCQPHRENDQKLEAAIAGTLKWAERYRESDVSHMRFRSDSIPFFDQSETARICSEIRKSAQNIDTQRQVPSGDDEEIFKARLLLSLAEVFDLQTEEADQELAELKNREGQLLAALGDGFSSSHSASGIGSPVMPVNDTGSVMTQKRLQSWARLALAENFPHSSSTPPFLLTSSSSVLQTVLDLVPDAVPILGDYPIITFDDMDSPAHVQQQRAVSDVIDAKLNIEITVHKKKSPSLGKTYAFLSIYRFADVTITALLQNMLTFASEPLKLQASHPAPLFLGIIKLSQN